MEQLVEAHKDEMSEMAYLRAKHYYGENSRVRNAFKALQECDQETFLKMINESRESSTKFLKNMI